MTDHVFEYHCVDWAENTVYFMQELDAKILAEQDREKNVNQMCAMSEHVIKPTYRMKKAIPT